MEGQFLKIPLDFDPILIIGPQTLPWPEKSKNYFAKLCGCWLRGNYVSLAVYRFK